MEKDKVAIECCCGCKVLLNRHVGESYTFSAKCTCGRYWILEDMSEGLKEKISDDGVLEQMF
ncbi:MAG: hypothetical protein N3G76_00885 [Candidatus Micrarchaeota archaeon]|nr:hypothetical protein [Candidatus Micrarchaeota archaeon]